MQYFTVIKKQQYLYIIVLLLFFVNGKVYAINNYKAGSRFAGFSNASVAVSDLWSVAHNQAGLADIRTMAIGFYHDNKFSVNELASNALVMAIPVKLGTFGLQYSYFGYAMYHESKTGLSFAKPFGKKYSVSVQLDYFDVFIPNSSNNNALITFETGFLTHLTNEFSLGIHVFNPLFNKTNKYDEEHLYSEISAGIVYAIKNAGSLMVEVDKELYFSPLLKVGVEMNALKKFLFRTGISTDNNRFSFGCGYKVSKFSIDLAFTFHQILGFTPHFGIDYMF